MIRRTTDAPAALSTPIGSATYRDRAECKNDFDEIKNRRGWRGYSTHDIERCALNARAVALIYNWWSWYVRLAHRQHGALECTALADWLRNSPG